MGWADYLSEFWLNESIEERRRRLMQEACEPAWVNSLDGPQLIHAILVSEGEADGELVKLKTVTSDKGTAESLVMLAEQVQVDQGERDAEARRLRGVAERRLREERDAESQRLAALEFRQREEAVAVEMALNAYKQGLGRLPDRSFGSLEFTWAAVINCREPFCWDLVHQQQQQPSSQLNMDPRDGEVPGLDLQQSVSTTLRADDEGRGGQLDSLDDSFSMSASSGVTGVDSGGQPSKESLLLQEQHSVEQQQQHSVAAGAALRAGAAPVQQEQHPVQQEQHAVQEQYSVQQQEQYPVQLREQLSVEQIEQQHEEQHEQQQLFTLFRLQAIEQWLWQRQQLHTFSFHDFTQQRQQQLLAFHCHGAPVYSGVLSESDGVVKEVSFWGPSMVYVNNNEGGMHTVADSFRTSKVALTLGCGTASMHPPTAVGRRCKKKSGRCDKWASRRGKRRLRKKWLKWALRRGKRWRKNKFRKWASWRKKKKSRRFVDLLGCGRHYQCFTSAFQPFGGSLQQGHICRNGSVD